MARRWSGHVMNQGSVTHHGLFLEDKIPPYTDSDGPGRLPWYPLMTFDRNFSATGRNSISVIVPWLGALSYRRDEDFWHLPRRSWLQRAAILAKPVNDMLYLSIAPVKKSRCSALATVYAREKKWDFSPSLSRTRDSGSMVQNHYGSSNIPMSMAFCLFRA